MIIDDCFLNKWNPQPRRSRVLRSALLPLPVLTALGARAHIIRYVGEELITLSHIEARRLGRGIVGGFYRLHKTKVFGLLGKVFARRPVRFPHLPAGWSVRNFAAAARCPVCGVGMDGHMRIAALRGGIMIVPYLTGLLRLIVAETA